MNSIRRNWFKLLALAAAFGAQGASAAAPTSPPPPPIKLAPTIEVIPYRPIPPGGAAYVMDLPPIAADGTRITINTNLDENSMLWHLRSAWNVAALNCLDAGQEPILQGYSAFLKQNVRTLSAANAALDASFRRDFGAGNRGVKAREAYMTQVYNYFALPPAREEFCNVALSVANRYLLAEGPATDVKQFATANLPLFEAAFQNFYRQYEQYQRDSAAWDQKWGAMYGSSQPGYVAVYGSAGPTAVSSLVNLSATQ